MSEPSLNRSLSDYQDLQSLFLSLHKPYRLGEVVRFNQAYLRLFPDLSTEQRIRANAWADALVASVRADVGCRVGDE